jgi:hypothetical protein
MASTSFKYGDNLKNSGMTQKELISYNIKNKSKIAYQNSKTAYIYTQIVNGNTPQMKDILMSLGLDVFKRYVNRILGSSSYNNSTKANVSATYETIITNLSINEQIQLGMIQVDNSFDNIVDIPVERTFYCKVVTQGRQRILVITNILKTTTLTPGKRYIFDLEDPTNAGTQISFSQYQYQYIELPGLSYVGEPGQPGAKTIYDVPQNINSYKIFIFNRSDASSDSYFIYPYMRETLTIRLNYKAVSKDVNQSIVDNFSVSSSTVIICLQKRMVVRSSISNGPKYILEPSNIDDFTVNNFNLAARYNPNARYGMFYGTYIFYVNSPRNPFTILNKGKEDLIRIRGDIDKKTTVLLKGLDTNYSQLDGEYDFYYGDIYIEVFGDFGVVGLYSFQYGINDMENYLVFSDKCYAGSGANDTYEDIFFNNIYLLHPQSIFQSIEYNKGNVIRFNNETTYVEDRIYGLSNRNTENPELPYNQYIIFGVPEEHPIAFINKEKIDNSGNPLLHYFGVNTLKKRRVGPDNLFYDFYYGTIVIYVYGDFGRMSVYDFYHGYSGAKLLLQYTDTDNLSSIEPINPSMDEIASQRSKEITQMVPIMSKDYMKFNLVNNTIILSDPSIPLTLDELYNSFDASSVYFFGKGNYVIIDVPKEHPIAFMTNNLDPSLFRYDGYFPFRSDEYGPHGIIYPFYYGNINLYIGGDFGRISMYVKNQGYFNGRKLISFAEETDFDRELSGNAVTQNSIDSAYPELTYNFDETRPRNFFIDVDIVTFPLPYSEDYSVFRFYGRDRNGELPSEQDNPTMTFFLGDIVYFTFIHGLKNTFAIFERANILIDPQVIENNGTTDTNLQIKWKPTLTLNNYYFYRSVDRQNLMYNNIIVINNNAIDIIPDLLIQDIAPSYGETNVSVEIQSFDLSFDEIININPNSTFTLYRKPLNQVVTVFKGSNISGSGTRNISLITNYDSFNRLDFNTEYFIKIDNFLLKNIYNNYLRPPYYKDEDGNPINPSDETDILFKFKTQPIHPPQLISIEYYEDICGIYLPLSTSSSLDPSGELQLNDDAIKLDVSGEILLTFDERIQYLTSVATNQYRLYPHFVKFGETVKSGDTAIYVDSDANTLSLKFNSETSTLDYDTTYKLVFNPGSIVDMSFIELDILNNELGQFYITTLADPRPRLNLETDIYPSPKMTAVPVDASFQLTFDKPVYPGTSGRIIVREQFQQIFFQVFDFTSQDDISAIIGWGTNVLEFSTPTPQNRENYEFFTNYTLIIEGSVIRSSVEEDNTKYYPGLNNEEEYYFRTATGTT